MRTAAIDVLRTKSKIKVTHSTIELQQDCTHKGVATLPMNESGIRNSRHLAPSSEQRGNGIKHSLIRDKLPPTQNDISDEKDNFNIKDFKGGKKSLKIKPFPILVVRLSPCIFTNFTFLDICSESLLRNFLTLLSPQRENCRTAMPAPSASLWSFSFSPATSMQVENDRFAT